MNRVSTFAMQRVMSDGVQRQQQMLADTQQQLATTKKVQDYAGLGNDIVRDLSSHTLASKQEAYVKVAASVGTTLSLYDANLGAIETSTTALRQAILTSVGTGNSAGLQDAMEAAFGQFRVALNASDGGGALFGGAQTDGLPFKPATLADMAGIDPAAAFTNDDVRASAQVGDGTRVTYGITASSAGEGLAAAFRTLADAGAIGSTPTDAQKLALNSAISQIDTGLTSLRAINAENGRTQAQVETLGTRATERGDLLKSIIGDSEDADLGQVAVDLSQRMTVLKASYSVIAQLSNLSLTNYLH